MDSLLTKAQSIVSKYNDQDKYKLNSIASDVVWSYFQDRFATTRYEVLTGGVGSGKSALSATFGAIGYRPVNTINPTAAAIGYRPVNTTNPTAAVIYRLLGPIEPGQCTRNRIAVVYSEDDVANAYAEIIRRGGYEVDVFTNPMLALEKIGSQHFIYLLVLTGWRMPRLRGLDLALDLFKIDPGIKIILFSALDPGMANNYLDQIARTFNVKFDHFYMLVTSEELLEMINNKIKYGKCDDPYIIRRDRLPTESKEGYRNTIQTHKYDWKMNLIRIGAAFAIMYIVVMILRSLGFFSW